MIHSHIFKNLMDSFPVKICFKTYVKLTALHKKMHKRPKPKYKILRFRRMCSATIIHVRIYLSNVI